MYLRNTYLQVWLVAAEGVGIEKDAEVERTHFAFLDSAEASKARELKG